MIEIARQSIPSLALGAWVAVFGSVQPFLGAALTFTVLAQTLAALTSPQLTAYAELATAVVAVAGACVQPSSGTLFWDSAPFPAALESIILGIAHQGYARDLLPLWARAVLAEAYTLAKWHATSRLPDSSQPPRVTDHWALSLLLAQVAGVIVPLLLFRQRDRRTEPAQLLRGRRKGPSRHASTFDMVSREAWTSAPLSDSASSSAALDPTLHKPPSEPAERASKAPLPYVSVLGRRETMSIKIATNHQPEDLLRRNGALSRLTTLIENTETYDPDTQQPQRRLVLGVSVMRGCILLQVQTCIPATPPTDTPTTSSAEAHIMACAERILPNLMTELGLTTSSTCSAAGAGRAAADGRGARVRRGSASDCHGGTYLELRIGDNTVRARWDGCALEWVVGELKKSGSSGSVGDLALAGADNALGRSTGSLSSSGDDLPRICAAMPRAAALPAVPARHGSDRSGGGAGDETTVVVAFTAQLRHCARRAFAGLRGVDPALPRGAHTVPATDTDTDTSGLTSTTTPTSNPLEVWAHVDGTYVPTVIQGLDRYTQTALIEAHVPVPLVTRHNNPDGAIARIQMLSVEVWEGESAYVGGTTVLWDPRVHGGMDVGCGRGDGFGWWTVGGEMGAGVVREMGAAAAELAAAGAPTDKAHESHEAFLGDLAVWLSYVRGAAPRALCDMTTTTAHVPVVAATHAPTLSTTHRTALAMNLESYARAAGMPQTAAMVRAQAAALAPTDACFPSRSGLDCVRLCVQSLWHPSRCGVCDQMYYKRLRSYLRHAHIYGTFALVVPTIVAQRQIYPDAQWLIKAFIYFTASSRLAVCFARVVCDSPARRAALGAAGAACAVLLESGVLDVIVWCLHLIAELVVGCVLQPPAKTALRPSLPYTTTHHLFTLISHQSFVWGCVPDWLLRGLLMIEVTLHSQIADKLHATRDPVQVIPPFGGFVKAKLWYVFGTLIVPYAMDRYWRYLLRSLSSTPTHNGSAHRGTGGAQAGVSTRRSKCADNTCSDCHSHAHED